MWLLLLLLILLCIADVVVNNANAISNCIRTTSTNKRIEDKKKQIEKYKDEHNNARYSELVTN